MNNAKKAAIVATFCVLVTDGCARYEPVPPPTITVNPDPVDQYKVLLTIPDPPGPMNLRAKVLYGIANKEDCVPLDRGSAIGGRHPSFGKEVDLPVVRRDEKNYELLFYGDALLREDYYGLGPCEWEVGSIISLMWGKEHAVVQVPNREEDLGVTHTRMCSVHPPRTLYPCVSEEYANSSVQTYFNIEIIATRSRL